MEKSEFDSAQVIGGFPILDIKRALTYVGLREDRDDVASVASSLRCPHSQAERVLAALERRGMVARTGKTNQWQTTDLGKRLAWHWQPPRKLQPAIALEPESDGINEVFDGVPCSILRNEDDEDMFEEAELEVGVFVEYASPRLVEISVMVPNDYENRDGGGTIDSSVYVSVDDAKRFARALQTAIDRAEKEIEGRKALIDRLGKETDARRRSKPSKPRATVVKQASRARKKQGSTR